MAASHNETNEVFRRVLHMVRELHTMGFERLRVMPSLAPSGCHWRVTVAPVTRFFREHGAICYWRDADGRPDGSLPKYTSASKRQYFGWTDALDDTPHQLAKKFVQRFPTVASEGKGSDPEYVKWYAEMLDATEPAGLIYAIADVPVPEDRIATINVPEGVTIPLPPGGTFGIDPSEQQREQL